MTKEYEQEIVEKLSNLILNDLNNKIIERDISLFRIPINIPLIKRQKFMEIENGLYSPRMDVTIGPYAFSPGGLNSLYSSFFEKEIIL